MNALALGLDTVWALIALGVLAAAVLVLPAVLRRGASAQFVVRANTVGARAGAIVTAASRTAVWAGLACALVVAAAPASALSRVARAGTVVAAVLVTLLVVWRALAIVKGEAAFGSDARISRVNRVSGAVRGLGLGTAALVTVAAIAFRGANAGESLLLAASGFAISGVALRCAAALAGVANAGASIDVGALESENPLSSAKDPGLGVGVLRALLASGPLRAVDTAALATLLSAATITVGVPIFGLSAITTAIVLSAAAVCASLILSFAPSLHANEARNSRMGIIYSAIASFAPLAIAASALGLWVPTSYSALRMKAVGLGDFTDPLLISLFVDSSSQSLPASIPRDDVESMLVQMAQNWAKLYPTVGDSPAAQSVMDTVKLHVVNPSLLTWSALAIAGLGGIASLVLMHWMGRSSGYQAARHAKFARISPAASALSFGGAVAPVAVLGALFLIGGWAVTMLAAGIAYLAFYMCALGAFALLIVWIGFSKAAGTDLALAPFELCADAEPSSVETETQNEASDAEPAEAESKKVAKKAKKARAKAMETLALSATLGDLFGEEAEARDSDESAVADGAVESEAQAPNEAPADFHEAGDGELVSLRHEYARHGLLDAFFSALIPALTALSLIAPLGAIMQAATKQLGLGADRALRVVNLNSPTVLMGVIAGALACALALALASDTCRRLLATAVIEARTVGLPAKGEAPAHIEVPQLASAARRQAAIVIMLAIMAPAFVGFWLGAAALLGYSVGAVACTLIVGATSAVREFGAQQSLRQIEARNYGGEGSLAEVNALIALSEARTRFSLGSIVGRGASAFGSLTALATLILAPIVVQLSTDGSHFLVRIFLALVAVGLVVATVVLARGVEQPDLDSL